MLIWGTPYALPAGFGHAGDFTGKSQFTHLGTCQTELAERTTGTTGDFATVALAGRVGVAGQLLQAQASGIALFIGTLSVLGDGLELVVLVDELGGEFLALQLTLEES